MTIRKKCIHFEVCVKSENPLCEDSCCSLNYDVMDFNEKKETAKLFLKRNRNFFSEVLVDAAGSKTAHCRRV